MKSSSEEAHSANPSAPEFQPKMANGVPAVGSNDPFLVKKNSKHRPLNKVKKVDPMPWSTGLFDCFSDVPNCCITFWCPCITFGKIAEIADQGNTSCVTNGAVYAFLELFTGCGLLYSCLYRHHLRHQLDLEEGPCNDCLVHFCCERCALCQEYRELRSRGFDMSIGWRGNAEEQDGGDQLIAPTAPLMEAERGP